MIDKDFLLIITSSEVGSGEADLGAKLTELLFKVLSESTKRPGRIIFLNSGIYLTTEGSPIIKLLHAIEEGGTEIISCSTCLNYLERRGKILVGRPGDMNDTVNGILNADKVVTL